MKYIKCWLELEHLELSYTAGKHVNRDNYFGRVWYWLLNLNVSVTAPEILTDVVLIYGHI